MNSKRIVLSLLTLFTFQVSSMAQDKWKSKFDSSIEPERRKWAVNIPVSTILKNINGDGTSINISVGKYSMGNPSKSAWKSDFSLDLYSGSSNPRTGYTDISNSFSSQITIGYERQYQLGKLMFSHGPSLGLSYSKNSNHSDIAISGVNYNESSNNSYLIYSLYSIGLRYFLNSTLSMVISSGIQAGYTKTKKYSTQFDSIPLREISSTESSYNYFKLSTFQTNVGLGIHF